MKHTIRKLVILLLALCIAVSACLGGCGSERYLPTAVSDVEKSALELCTDSYTDVQLKEIYDFMGENSTAAQLNDAYTVECLRLDDDGFHVIYEGTKKILVLRFDAQGNWVSTAEPGCLFRMITTRGKFDGLSVGDNVAVVQKIDSTGFYPFLETDIGGPLASDHYTEDGYLTHITYDEDYNILSVDSEIM